MVPVLCLTMEHCMGKFGHAHDDIWLFSEITSVRWLFFSIEVEWSEEVVDSKHVTYRENAMFLLDLASTAGGRSTDNETSLDSGTWAVGEFKCLANLGASARHQSDTNDAILLQLRDDSSVYTHIHWQYSHSSETRTFPLESVILSVLKIPNKQIFKNTIRLQEKIDAYLSDNRLNYNTK